jgi:hypothetical protein
MWEKIKYNEERVENYVKHFSSKPETKGKMCYPSFRLCPRIIRIASASKKAIKIKSFYLIIFNKLFLKNR